MGGWVVPHDADLDPTFVLKPAEIPAAKSTGPPVSTAKVLGVIPTHRGKAADNKIEGSKMTEKRKRLEEEESKKWEEEMKRRKEEKRREREEKKKKEEETRKKEIEKRNANPQR